MHTIQADFDRIARLEDLRWNHNRHYHPFLLRQLPSRLVEALDVGCGQGDFARLLALRAERVLAIDLSPEMIQRAKEQSAQHPNIRYQVTDVMAWEWPTDQYDCIVSIATLHHLSLADVLIHMKDALKPGGTLLVLDLFHQDGVTLRDFIAVVASASLKFLKNGRLREPAALRAAWGAHAKHDHYLPLSEIREICASILPGACVQQHLLWRYSIVWKKP
ncbi:MAG: methyltransferase domain-containing protein [Anaerolineae bacterium]|nr:methyltransferase domain-containing protein [Anaerolineae bacterium]